MKYILIAIVALMMTACSAEEPTTLTEINLGSCESDIHIIKDAEDNAYGYNEDGNILYCYAGLDD